MNHDYTVSAALPTDLEAILEILRQRQQWLAERHIVQWEGYENFFPRSYFEGKLAEGKLLVARDASGTVCGLIALADQDPYWAGKERPGALYLHNLASAPEARGACLLYTSPSPRDCS